jgi:uncharacterized protein YyaL (SSP411 family)
MHAPPASAGRLREATSPYLQQHADNPVDWWPWCEEALRLAREQDRPILLSIGYSACHWCHVMAHESFEDEGTAALMNRLFINIKVDREERPDLDRIYQRAHQLLVQRAGGWPLTLFLSPHDLTPFFCGTYFPREPRHGLPAFGGLMQQVEQAYREQGSAIEGQNRALREALASLDFSGDGGQALDATPLWLARETLEQTFDAHFGGFGPAPKFPHTTSLEFLLQQGVAGAGDGQAMHLVTHTLEQMALGGINDQLGGGFFRYSVDERWEIPHFEKMLYDNALLLPLYLDAWQSTGHPLFRQTAEGTAAWVMREMQAPQGGFYSSLDADSEGEEGRFYVWSREQVASLLDEAEYALYSAFYGLDRHPNFEAQWHLHGQIGLEGFAEGAGPLLERARDKLFESREQRIRPGRDEKILAAWNGLMIKAMARGARRLGRGDLQASAERALNFLRHNLWRNGRLLASWRDGRGSLAAYLDDYAYLLDALLELLQLRWRQEEFEFAVELAEVLLTHFEDRERGGFYFTADDHEPLIQRPRPWSDDAMPAGNGVVALALIRLGHLAAEPRYLAAAERTLQAAWPHLEHNASAHGALLLALEASLRPPETLLILGREQLIMPWYERANLHYAPHRQCYVIPQGVAGPAHVAGLQAEAGPLALYCKGTACGEPITEFETFEQALT